MISFKRYLKTKKLIILDGAMGTELSRRGIKTYLPLWSAQALIKDPLTVQQIHEDYINAGAQIITTNTFRTNLRTIKRVKTINSARALTRKAVNLAKKAVKKTGKEVYIAGSIAPVEDCYEPNLVPSDAELKKEHAISAGYLKNAGIDLILIETMNTIREARIAAEAAKKTGLPVLVSFVTGKNGRILSGESLKKATSELEKIKVNGLLINCMPLQYSVKPLKELLKSTQLPVGIYANGEGKPGSNQGWEFNHRIEINKYLRYAKKWRKMGAVIIGGCCGTAPEYIDKINKLLNE